MVCFTGEVFQIKRALSRGSNEAKSCSEQLLKFFDAHARIAHDGGHRVCVNRVVPGNHHFNRSFGHEDVFALPVNLKSSLGQGLYRPEVVNTWKLGHGSARYFQFTNLATGLWFSVKLQVTFNGIPDVVHSFFNGLTLRMATRQFRTTYRNAVRMLQQSHMEFPFRHDMKLRFANRVVNVEWHKPEVFQNFTISRFLSMNRQLSE
jgi:hypothetical protein